MNIKTPKGLINVKFYYEVDGQIGLHLIQNNSKINTCCQVSEVVDVTKRGPERFNRLGFGVTTRSPKDRFNKDFGRKLALNRALQKAGLDTETKKEIWNAYFKQHRSAISTN